MTVDTIVVFGVLGITVALFVSDRIRLDLVAIISLLTLLLAGILTPQEGLAGFADPIVLMIAGLFIVGGGIFHTGVADALGRWLGRIAGGGETKLIGVLMVVTATLSAFISSTGTVAVLLPAAVTLARGAGLNPSRVLIPLAFASLFGGMLTLIGTPPNIVVSNQLRAQGLEPFGFFAFTPVGLVMLAIGILFMLTLGRRLLPDRSSDTGNDDETHPTAEARSGDDLVGDYDLRDNILQFHIAADDPCAGHSIGDANLRERFGGTVLEIRRSGPDIDGLVDVSGSTIVQGGDLLSIQVAEDALDEIKTREAASLVSETATGAPLPRRTLLAEVLLTPRSRLIGNSIKRFRFRDRYGANVLSIKRSGRALDENAASAKLRFGDALLVEGSRRELSILRDEHRDFVVVTEPHELRQRTRNTDRAPLAVAIMLGMLLLMTFGVVANVTAVLVAAAAMVLTRCLTMTQAYRSISWESVVLIAAILPMATALDKSGGIRLIVDGLTSWLGGAGPLVMMICLFVLTSLFSQVISNTATTVLIAPIAFQMAEAMDASPRAFLMVVAIAASTAFATPIASPVNTLVLNPGGYRFLDFVKVGTLLQLFVLIATILVVPLLF